MPEDAKFPFEYDESGDRASVTGEDFYYRHALQLGLMAVENVKGRPTTESDRVQVRDEIGRKLVSSPYFDEPIVIKLVDFDEEHVTAEVKTPNVSKFEITV